jgi:hypothetical protein
MSGSPGTRRVASRSAIEGVRRACSASNARRAHRPYPGAGVVQERGHGGNVLLADGTRARTTSNPRHSGGPSVRIGAWATCKRKAQSSLPESERRCIIEGRELEGDERPQALLPRNRRILEALDKRAGDGSTDRSDEMKPER